MKRKKKILVEWDHDDSDVEFEVSAGAGGSLNKLTTTSDKKTRDR